MFQILTSSVDELLDFIRKTFDLNGGKEKNKINYNKNINLIIKISVLKQFFALIQFLKEIIKKIYLDYKKKFYQLRKLLQMQIKIRLQLKDFIKKLRL